MPELSTIQDKDKDKDKMIRQRTNMRRRRKTAQVEGTLPLGNRGKKHERWQQIR